MARRIADLAFASLVCAGSIWFWTLAAGFPVSRRYASVDTAFWPSIVYAVLALLSGALVVQMLLALRAAAPAPAAVPAAAPPDRSRTLRILAIGALIVVYFLAFRVTGFLLATILFLWAASFLLDRRNPVAKLVFAPVFTLAITLLFSRVLSLPLPRGIEPFYGLNLMLY